MSSGLFSGKSGLAIGQGLYRVVSSLWSGASGFVTDWDAVVPPLVSIDFKNGVYSINSVPKTLGEVCEQNLNWSTYSASDVVAGVGYYKAAGSTPEGPVLTAAAYAAVGKEFVAVLGYVMDTGTGSPTQMSIQFSSGDFSTYADGFDSLIGIPWSGTALICDMAVGCQDMSPASAAATAAAGAHRTAFRVESGGTDYASTDGLANDSVAQSAMATADAIGFFVTSAGTGSVTVEKIEFFSLADYAAGDLPGLSA